MTVHRKGWAKFDPTPIGIRLPPHVIDQLRFIVATEKSTQSRVLRRELSEAILKRAREILGEPEPPKAPECTPQPNSEKAA
jgi:hypothetical protein